MEMSEQNWPEQPIACCSEMLRDREGPAKSNYTDLTDKWEQKTHTHTHTVPYLYLLQSMAGGQSCEGVREVPDFTLVVAVLSSLWEKTHARTHARSESC